MFSIANRLLMQCDCAMWSPFRPSPGAQAAFTLVELVTVMAIIALISGLVVASGTRANATAHSARARAELAALGAALESYKIAYGDYPRTADAAVLLQSLIGKRGPTQVEINGNCFVDFATFATFGDLDPFATTSAEVVDPWGQSYRYAYRSSASWTQPAFVLFSCGPDKSAAALLTGGVVDDSAVQNRDNLYAHR